VIRSTVRAYFKLLKVPWMVCALSEVSYKSLPHVGNDSF